MTKHLSLPQSPGYTVFRAHRGQKR